jgi:hypothetical protein
VHRASILALPFLSTGGALVVYILSGISLLLGIALVGALAGVIAILVWHRLPAGMRPTVVHRVKCAAIAGVAATGAYDVCRLVIVRLFDLQFWPFDVFTQFGALLVGESVPSPVVTAVGTAYHYMNGIGFGIAYVLFIRRPGIVTGLLWAAVLEGFMVSLYPGWLSIEAMNEFRAVSVVGHVAYGITLGSVARVLLREDRLTRKPHVSSRSN